MTPEEKKEHDRAIRRAWYQAHKQERIDAASRRYYENHEAEKARCREYARRKAARLAQLESQIRGNDTTE